MRMTTRNDEKKSEEVAGDQDSGWTGGHFRSVTTLLSLILFASILNVKAQDTRPDEQSMNSLLEEVRRMRQTIDRLEARVNKLEAEKGEAAAKQAPAPNETNQVRGAAVSAGSSITEAAGKDASALAQTATLSAGDRGALDFWRDTTVNLTVDGYYGYNFNRPPGGINLLRANDVLSDSFSLNQATVILEQAPNVEAGRRFGARLDLMFGQETETVQGSAVNELRPLVYRHIWQAYGTYVAPVGNGLMVDFGKFASSLGYETNYAKDNFNYSRSYFFNFLPFYHSGFRTKYPVNDELTVMYHLVNGVNQSEDFNGFKSQHVAFIVKPGDRVTAQLNYYFGREQRVRTSILNPTFPVLPTQPGLSPVEIRPAPDGRLHILDAYATLNLTDKLTFAFEGDYVVNRFFENSPPSRVTGGVAYARYQFSPRFAVAGRFEYLSDRGGLFSGVTQALKEHTLTAEYKFGEGFLMRGEYRRDYSNQPFFLTETPGALKREQNTATLGLVWWWGRKEGVW